MSEDRYPSTDVDRWWEAMTTLEQTEAKAQYEKSLRDTLGGWWICLEDHQREEVRDNRLIRGYND